MRYFYYQVHFFFFCGNAYGAIQSTIVNMKHFFMSFFFVFLPLFCNSFCWVTEGTLSFQYIYHIYKSLPITLNSRFYFQFPRYTSNSIIVFNKNQRNINICNAWILNTKTTSINIYSLQGFCTYCLENNLIRFALHMMVH